MTALTRLTLALLAALLLGGASQAQKLGKYHEDEEFGFRFKLLQDFQLVPGQPREQALGVLVKADGKTLSVRSGSSSISIDVGLTVLRFEEVTVRSGGDDGDDDRSVSETKVRRDLAEYLDAFYKGVDEKNPDVDEEKKIKGLVAQHRQWSAQTPQYGIQLVLDCWSFPLEDADVHVVYMVPEEHGKKWLKAYEKSAKTFQVIPRKAKAGLGKGASYEDQLAYHKAEAEKVGEWTALATPSEKFIIVTNSDNRKFLKSVIDRLEKSRELYERDFPPTEDFDHVSIVRVCGTEEEFHKYGGTGGGTAGWFNPSSTELVLYDAVNVNRNMTYAVMSHEAFHQYCHFLFGQSEAHRWFDEGHGDYYGGVEFKGSRAKVTNKMPAGLNRLDVIEDMVAQGTYAPLEDHLNFNHREWQTQGPSNVSCYAQSWSIIYMLRQGTLGNVPRSVWKPEYADILPNYVTTLNAGFREAYDELRAMRRAEAEEEGRELTEEELDVTRRDLERELPGRKLEIWRKAMDASWGQIDLTEFEANWVKYVDDHIR